MSRTLFATPVVVEKLTKEFGNKVRTVTVDMKYQQPVGQFLRKVEAARKATANSRQVFRSA